MSSPPRQKPVAIRTIALVALATLAGCSGEGARAPRVEPAKARETLRLVLDRWKEGAKPDSLKAGSPPIFVQDFDWTAGLRLVDYEVTGDGKDDDANLRIPVRLTLRDPGGREVRKEVSYVVGTAPALTVFREML